MEAAASSVGELTKRFDAHLLSMQGAGHAELDQRLTNVEAALQSGVPRAEMDQGFAFIRQALDKWKAM